MLRLLPIITKYIQTIASVPEKNIGSNNGAEK